MTKKKKKVRRVVLGWGVLYLHGNDDRCPDCHDTKAYFASVLRINRTPKALRRNDADGKYARLIAEAIEP